MSNDRSWIGRRVGPIGITYEFEQGVRDFLDFAYSHPEFVADGKIKCPCNHCQLLRILPRMEVQYHLVRHGFLSSYTIWYQHGERVQHVTPTRMEHIQTPVQNMGQTNEFRNLVMDAGGFQYDYGDNIDEPVNPDAQKFYDLLKDADEPLWAGCEKHSKLSMMTTIMSIKCKYGIPEGGVEEILQMLKSGMPSDEKLPDSYYSLKKSMKKLGLGYEKIHACVNDCILYYKEYKDLTECPTCNHPRFRSTSVNHSRKQIAHKVLRYLPLTPRLQRLYHSKKTAEHMRWHRHKRIDGNLDQEEVGLVHPVDGEAWKHLDRTYPSFASEIRNLRLGLSTDGFCPFGMSSKVYSCWPVFIFPYNLPPWMCMTKPFMFLTLLIPGPKSPGRDIDVYLRPLIDELKDLWAVGVYTYDAYGRQNFNLKACLMWTISDFPAYGMLSGWSTHGCLACPYCMERCKGYRLKKSMKTTWFDCHRQFLPSNHRFRSDTVHFRKGVKVRSILCERLSGEEVGRRVFSLLQVPYGKSYGATKLDGYGRHHNWTKKSIFYDLPYWDKLLIRHNLDVMHIEKNVFDNIFNTLMNVKGKSKDHLKARLDMKEMNIRPELYPQVVNDKTVLPPARYYLRRDEVKLVCEWVSKLKFPDGYVSNISRCVNVAEGKISGFKSHDCHVFMQRLLPIAFCELLPKDVVEVLSEVSKFFRDLCCTTLKESDMDVLQCNIVQTVCKLEKIFPPTFFDSMEHLLIHLPYEAKVGGPVQYRWMYRIERELYGLKKKVRNKARVEGSIVEAYCLDELSIFCSHYFGDEAPSRLYRQERNFDGGQAAPNDRLSIFQKAGRGVGKKTSIWLNEAEYNAAFLYILLNCDEVIPFTLEFEAITRSCYPNISEMQVQKETESKFIKWFQDRVRADNNVDARLKLLAEGPRLLADRWPGYIINGFKFQIKNVDSVRSTQNHGVWIKGNTWNESYGDFYGSLLDVYNISFHEGDVVLFKCDWVDTTGRGIKVDNYGNIRVNLKMKLKTYEPFVLASQASQVFFVPCVTKKPMFKDLCNVIKTRARSTYVMPQYEEEPEDLVSDEVFQEDESSRVIRNSDNIYDDTDLYRLALPSEEVVSDDFVELQNEEEGDFGDEEEEIDSDFLDTDDEDEEGEEFDFDSDSE